MTYIYIIRSTSIKTYTYFLITGLLSSCQAQSLKPLFPYVIISSNTLTQNIYYSFIKNFLAIFLFLILSVYNNRKSYRIIGTSLIQMGFLGQSYVPNSILTQIRPNLYVGKTLLMDCIRVTLCVNNKIYWENALRLRSMRKGTGVHLLFYPTHQKNFILSIISYGGYVSHGP